MPSLISHLPNQNQFLDALNYLNMQEIQAFCDLHAIGYRIGVCTADGGLRRTKDIDRKGIVLDRIRCYLCTGVVPEPTCFPARVVSFAPFVKFST